MLVAEDAEVGFASVFADADFNFTVSSMDEDGEVIDGEIVIAPCIRNRVRGAFAASGYHLGRRCHRIDSAQHHRRRSEPEPDDTRALHDVAVIGAALHSRVTPMCSSASIIADESRMASAAASSGAR